MSSVLPSADQQKSRKRKFQSRASQACDMCRTKKAKCDQGRPCQTCEARQFICEYTHVSARRVTVAAGLASSLSREASQCLSGHQQEPEEQLRAFHQRSTGSHQQQATAAASPAHDILHGAIDPSGKPDIDTISAVNVHTSGTEFYGQSSNFVFLNQLLCKTRRYLSPRNGDDRGLIQPNNGNPPNVNLTTRDRGLQSEAELVQPTNHRLDAASDEGKDTSTTPMSIVNILYDDNLSMTEASHAAPLTVAGRAQKSAMKAASPPRQDVSENSRSRDQHSSSGAKRPSVAPTSFTKMPGPTSLRRADDLSNSPACFFGTPMLLEMEYVDLFFKNIHYIHPFLNHAIFKARCEKEIWAQRLVTRLRQDQMHFMALYNAVLAIGALTAGTDLLLAFRAELEKDKDTGKQGTPPTSRRLSQLYFQRARRLLGDVFEVCSLESSQTLLLMSIYCQHALKPHACHMYSGMAVRHALAIGLHSGNNFRTDLAGTASSKTWWSIYSQEIEISCTSGRLSSVPNAADYQILFPEIFDTSRAGGNIPDQAHVSIISEIAKLSAIMQQALTELYHSPKHTTQQQRSQIAIELDQRLDSWMANILPCLNPNSSELEDLEWESKQKLLINIRFYTTKMFLHRPFVSNSVGTSNPEFISNIEACVDAARKTLSILYDAYKHRHYFRTWWYNSTHALYACVIVLYLILLDCTQVPASELVQDVRKGLRVLHAMEEMDVARRSAELLSEILDVVEKHISTPSREREDFASNVGYSIQGEVVEFQNRPALDSNFITTRFDSHRYSNCAESMNQHSDQNPEIGTARDSISAALMCPGLLEGFATGLDDSMLMHLGGPISDTVWGIGGEYTMLNAGNGEEYDAHWGCETGANNGTG